MTVEEFFDKVITVRLKEDKSALDIIDQTLLPGTIKRIQVSTKEEIWEAIKKREGTGGACHRGSGCLWDCIAGLGNHCGPV